MLLDFFGTSINFGAGLLYLSVLIQQIPDFVGLGRSVEVFWFGVVCG